VYECVVCGFRARKFVQLCCDEVVRLCSDRCRRRLLRDPVHYLGVLRGAPIPEQSSGQLR